MFPYADPHTRIELNREHVADMVRSADEYRQARAARNGRRFARWRRDRARSGA